ncbi:MAG: helix-turn-helix domain-containing protein [Propionibacteriaceae bacterium]|nr:helix-turn-helix domain-containing protein [Propionibacteriaceae bacterium]
MNRSEILRRGLSVAGIGQSELSRLTGVPQSKVSRYATGRLEPSEPTLDRLMAGLGLQVSFDLAPILMERTKLRDWLLHRAISRKLSAGLGETDWERMRRNLDQVRAHTQGQPHERNLDRWQRIIDSRDLRALRHVLLDPSTDGIEMREVSPMSGFLTDDERLKVLAQVRR